MKEIKKPLRKQLAPNAQCGKIGYWARSQTNTIKSLSGADYEKGCLLSQEQIRNYLQFDYETRILNKKEVN